MTIFLCSEFLTYVHALSGHRSLTDARILDTDFVIIGAGIAGASVAHWLAPHGRVVLLEREDQPGYHSTGRSAALFMESYGTTQVRALTMASRAFLQNPPDGFSEHRLLTPRGALFVGTRGQDALLEKHWEVLRTVTPDARRLSAQEAHAMVPVLRLDQLVGAVYEPDASDMDVHAIHQGYLRGMRQAGGTLVCNAPVTAMVCWRRPKIDPRGCGGNLGLVMPPGPGSLDTQQDSLHRGTS